ncbi:MAG: hypothetical protein ACYTFQ_27565, partial [Planctomycetota bacterium]
MLQRYLSTELTHFVGRSLGRDEKAQFGLLCTILESGELRASYVVPVTGQGATGEYTALHKPGAESSVMSGDSDGRLADGSKYSGSMVCFCDIPVS